MNKEKVAYRVGKQARILGQDVENVLHLVLSEWRRELIKGRTLEIYGFGTFKVVTTKPKKGNDMVRGIPFDIPPQRKLKFRPTEDLKGKIANYKAGQLF